MTDRAEDSFVDSSFNLAIPLSRLLRSNLMSAATAHLIFSYHQQCHCLPLRCIHAHVAGIGIKTLDGNGATLKTDRQSVFGQEVVPLVSAGAGQAIELCHNLFILCRVNPTLRSNFVIYFYSTTSGRHNTGRGDCVIGSNRCEGNPVTADNRLNITRVQFLILVNLCRQIGDNLINRKVVTICILTLNSSTPEAAPLLTAVNVVPPTTTVLPLAIAVTVKPTEFADAASAACPRPLAVSINDLMS